jgi:hypothetical protein
LHAEKADDFSLQTMGTVRKESMTKCPSGRENGPDEEKLFPPQGPSP